MRLAWVHGKGKGAGWLMLSKRGDTLVRGPIDACVGSPERLSYEGETVIDDGISRLASGVEGGRRHRHAVRDGSGSVRQPACARGPVRRCWSTRPRRTRSSASGAMRRKVAYRGEHVAKAVKRGIPREKAEKAYDESIAAGSATIGERTWLPLTDEHVLYSPGGDRVHCRRHQGGPVEIPRHRMLPIRSRAWTISRRIARSSTPTAGRSRSIQRAHGDAYAYVAPMEFDNVAFARIRRTLRQAGAARRKRRATTPETFDDLPLDLKKMIAAAALSGGRSRRRASDSAAFRLFGRGWTSEAVEAVRSAPRRHRRALKNRSDPHVVIQGLCERFVESGNQQARRHHR